MLRKSWVVLVAAVELAWNMRKGHHTGYWSLAASHRIAYTCFWHEIKSLPRDATGISRASP